MPRNVIKVEIPPEAWRPKPGMGTDYYRAEQDAAAGGPTKRKVLLDGRCFTASVELKQPSKGRRIYAYLRYSIDSRTVNQYIGDVSATTRATCLRKAWNMARKKGLLGHQE